MTQPKDKAPHAEQPADGSTEVQVKIIKRYTNRKLYDTVESRYVTLDEIADMIRFGEEVRVVDNKTKEDLTSVTFAQIIFEQEKKTAHMPMDMLRDMVRHGGESLHVFFEREIQPRVATIREGAGTRIERMFRRPDNQPGGPETTAETRQRLAEFLVGLQENVEEWQQRLDDRFQATMQSVGGFSNLQKELQTLRLRLDEVQKKLRTRDKKSGNAPDDTTS